MMIHSNIGKEEVGSEQDVVFLFFVVDAIIRCVMVILITCRSPHWTYINIQEIKLTGMEVHNSVVVCFYMVVL